MNDDDIIIGVKWRMEPRGIVKNARRILVMTSAKQQPLGRIFSTRSPSIRMALNGDKKAVNKNSYNPSNNSPKRRQRSQATAIRAKDQKSGWIPFRA